MTGPKPSVIVTIGICVRNCEKTIKGTMESVLKQDFRQDQIEIILVDDGSTDKTLQMIEEFNFHAKTKVYHQEWRGVAAARNLVVNNAKGDYIIWVDGDMQIPIDHVRRQVEHMMLNPKVGVAKARYGLTNDKKIVAILENARAFDLKPSNSKVFGTGGSICRVRAIREAGGFDETIFGAGEDIDVLVRIMRNGWLISTSDTYFYEQFKADWNSLWRQYYWWGYGAHIIRHKYKNAISLATRLPPISVLVGLLRFFRVFKVQRKLAYILLPLQNMFKENAWLAGFFFAHFDGYGH